MSMLKSDFIQMMEDIAPQKYAEHWDNVGMLLDTGQESFRRVLVALDLSDAVAQEAIDRKCDLVLTHHPIFFSAVRRLSVDDPTQRAAMTLLRAGISHFAAHTNFDRVQGGMNDQLCQKLGLQEIYSIDGAAETWEKLVVFVPETHAQLLRDAFAEAGIGTKGNYSRCSFSSPGEGRFCPEGGASPFLGEKGKIEVVKEIRQEYLLAERDCVRAEQIIREVHPYEEPAYDRIRLQNAQQVRSDNGFIWMGCLEEPMLLADFAKLVAQRLNNSGLRYSGQPKQKIRNVAVSTGAGADGMLAALRAGAEAFVTGELKHNQALDAVELGIPVLEAGHYETEKQGMDGLMKGLQFRCDRLKWEVEWLASERETAPMQTI